MAKHSPGPWRWEGDDLLDAEGCLVTRVVDSLRPWCDAGVIEAAPEMYEMLMCYLGDAGVDALLARIDGSEREPDGT